MSRLLLTGIFAVLLLNFSGAAQRADSAELQAVAATSEQKGEQGEPVRHICVRFDPESVHVAGDARGYWLASEGNRITSVNGSRAEARLAVYIIRFYGMNEFCRIGRGRGAMTYYLVNGWAPQGRSPSEDCLWFDQYGSLLKEVDGQWTLVDRNDTALSLGRNRAAALEAVTAIRDRNFSEICFVGRPSASMIYFIR